MSQAYEKFPKLKELKEKGIDVDYIIDSENINTDNKEQEAWDEGTRKIADEHPVVSSALSVGSNLLSPLELAEDVNHAVKNLSSDKSYPINHASHPYSSYTNNVRQTVSEGIDNDIGKFVYNAGMSTVDSAADILVTKGVKGTKLAGGAASALMGANAANQSYMDTYERTGSAGQSLITGLGAGLAEWASEKFSLDSFEALKTTNPKQFRDFASIIAELDDREERQEYLAIMQENTELLLQLISDILDLAKIEAGTLDYNMGYVDVSDFCKDVMRNYDIKEDKAVPVLLAPDLPDYRIYTDKKRLMQVVTNFINNALKFTSEGQILLEYHPVEGTGQIEFSVTDTGMGIAPDAVVTVFDRFVKLNTFAKGTGLGLSICKSIIEHLGGTIGAESELGVGSRFWFRHPCAE